MNINFLQIYRYFNNKSIKVLLFFIGNSMKKFLILIIRKKFLEELKPSLNKLIRVVFCPIFRFDSVEFDR